MELESEFQKPGGYRAKLKFTGNVDEFHAVYTSNNYYIHTTSLPPVQFFQTMHQPIQIAPAAPHTVNNNNLLLPGQEYAYTLPSAPLPALPPAPTQPSNYWSQTVDTSAHTLNGLQRTLQGINSPSNQGGGFSKFIRGLFSKKEKDPLAQYQAMLAQVNGQKAGGGFNHKMLIYAVDALLVIMALYVVFSPSGQNQIKNYLRPLTNLVNPSSVEGSKSQVRPQVKPQVKPGPMEDPNKV
jgi:hypothetical protein